MTVSWRHPTGGAGSDAVPDLTAVQQQTEASAGAQELHIQADTEVSQTDAQQCVVSMSLHILKSQSVSKLWKICFDFTTATSNETDFKKDDCSLDRCVETDPDQSLRRHLWQVSGSLRHIIHSVITTTDRQQTVTQQASVQTKLLMNNVVKSIKTCRCFFFFFFLSSNDAAGPCECDCECSSAPPACLSRGKLLLHCFLQGLKAGLNEGTGKHSGLCKPQSPVTLLQQNKANMTSGYKKTLKMVKCSQCEKNIGTLSPIMYNKFTIYVY